MAGFVGANNNNTDTTTTRLGTLVQIASYNTNLQGDRGIPQDLVDWLAPTLTVSSFLSGARSTRSTNPGPPDIVAVGFQELLPLHLGFSGFSKSVIKSRNTLIRAQIEKHHQASKSGSLSGTTTASDEYEKYTLVAHEVFVGVALLVYVRDAMGSRVKDIHTSWTGCGPLWMGNKGAVGIRFTLKAPEGKALPDEVFTFVNAHLTAHASKCHERLKDWNHIVRTLLFPPLSSPFPPRTNQPTTMYHTSHLFFAGDLNFRLNIPKDHELRNVISPTLENTSIRTPLLFHSSSSTSPSPGSSQSLSDRILNLVNSTDGREYLKDLDELRIERRRGTVCQSLREPPFWIFNCTYKYKIGSIDIYNMKRIPAWTDRVLYTTYADQPENGSETSKIIPLVYTSVPSYTTSDHKPIVALLVVPSPALTSGPSFQSTTASSSTAIPLIPTFPSISKLSPDPYALVKRYTGRYIGRVIGLIWYLFVVIGLGNAAIGVGNVIIGLGMWGWGWRGIFSTFGLWRSSIGRTTESRGAAFGHGEGRPNV